MHSLRNLSRLLVLGIALTALAPASAIPESMLVRKHGPAPSVVPASPPASDSPDAPLLLSPDTCPRRMRAERCTELLHDVFERAFFDESVYSPLACNANVHALLRRIERAGFNARNFRVLYLGTVELFDGRYISSGKTITGLSSREGTIAWNFHVVLETQGHILDLDYTSEPEIVPARQYFLDMFGSDSRALIGIRSIAGNAYLRDYSEIFRPGRDQLRNWAYYLYDTEGRYPAKLIPEFLGSL